MATLVSHGRLNGAVLRRSLKPYTLASTPIALWQLASTLALYVGLWWLMAYSVQQGWPYLITLAMAIPAAGLMVRVFIIFHDCTHRSFLAPHWANTAVGIATGLLTFTAYHAWRGSHIRHHATAGNLDRRGQGDVWTLTVDEYRSASPWRRAVYRVFRAPLATFVLGPPLSFVLAARFPEKGARPAERLSVLLTDLGLAAMVALLWMAVGPRTLLLVQVPILWLGTAAGVWLFYVQHQYEGVYWARGDSWDATRAAMEGCSFLRLPRVLDWFSGSIGVHHVHHLRPAIPNYRLQACQRELPALAQVRPLTLGQGWESMWLDLYDEQAGELISFREEKRRRGGKD